MWKIPLFFSTHAVMNCRNVFHTCFTCLHTSSIYFPHLIYIFSTLYFRSHLVWKPVPHLFLQVSTTHDCGSKARKSFTRGVEKRLKRGVNITIKCGDQIHSLQIYVWKKTVGTSTLKVTVETLSTPSSTLIFGCGNLFHTQI